MKPPTLAYSRGHFAAPSQLRRSDAASDADVSVEGEEGDVIIATVNRPQGDTGVHAHTRALSEGLARAGVGCEVVSPFSESTLWFPIFALRPLLLNHLNKTWSTRWYRYWHTAALRDSLRARLARRPTAAVIAQCPLSAQAALDVRAELELDFPIAAVCHFNYSEATEYRDKGELTDEAAFQAVLDLETKVLRAVDTLIYASGWGRNVVEVERGIKPRSSTVVWNGIPSTSSAGHINRQELGLSADDLVLINVGTLEARKNQLGLLDLFSLIAERSPSARLILVGDGPQRTAIETKIETLGLTDRVKCLGFRSDVPALFAAADIYIHYAKLENCPVILLEAARAGLPIAAIPNGGTAEVLAALGTGVVLNDAELAGSIKAMTPLLTDPSIRRDYGRDTHAGFLREFTQDAMVSGYLKQLKSIGAKIRRGGRTHGGNSER